MPKGKFLVIEGGEGSGKSTQLTKLVEYVSKPYPGRDFVFTREPGGTPLADDVRRVMISDEAKDASGRTMLGLIMASRSDHTERYILPVLAEGRGVISDRYLASSYAYQIAAQQRKDLEEVFWAYAKGFPMPDLYILLDVDPAIGRARAEARESRSHFHARPLDFHERVRSGYKAYFEKAYIPVAVVDANQNVEEVWKDVEKAVTSVI